MLLYKLDRESNKADSIGDPQRSFEANNQFISYSIAISFLKKERKKETAAPAAVAAAAAAPGRGCGAVGKRHLHLFKPSLSNDNAP